MKHPLLFRHRDSFYSRENFLSFFFPLSRNHFQRRRGGREFDCLCTANVHSLSCGMEKLLNLPSLFLSSFLPSFLSSFLSFPRAARNFSFPRSRRRRNLVSTRGRFFHEIKIPRFLRARVTRYPLEIHRFSTGMCMTLSIGARPDKALFRTVAATGHVFWIVSAIRPRSKNRLFPKTVYEQGRNKQFFR